MCTVSLVIPPLHHLKHMTEGPCPDDTSASGVLVITSTQTLSIQVSSFLLQSWGELSGFGGGLRSVSAINSRRSKEHSSLSINEQ